MRGMIAGLALLCMMSPKILLLEEHAIQIYTYSTTMEAEIEPEEAEDPEPASHYYGSCRITFYCPCSQCCGSWGNATASGAMPTAGWTVANGSLPFGTKVIIDGHTYCVEDRGVGSDQFDIFVNSHQEALDRGLYYTDVYIVE